MLTVRIENVCKTYRKTLALDNVSLEIGPGITCLLGKNGAGKSTLVRQIVGMERPSAGTIDFILDGRSLEGRERYAAGGWLPQAFGYPANMTVKDFVSYAAWLKEFPRALSAARVSEVVEVVDLHAFEHKKLGELSGGMLRRAGLAAAIVHRPSVLILDEPTAGLDPIQRAEFHQRIMALGESTTILIATHLLEDVLALAKNVEVLDAGHASWRGSTADLARVAGADVVDVDTLRHGLIKLVGPASS